MQLLAPPWAKPGGILHRRVRAVSTTRDGGVSAPPYDSLNFGDHVDDDLASVTENRALLQQWMRTAEPIRWLDQVHGTEVVDAADWVSGKQADAIISRQPGVPVAVLTADCVPLLLAAEDASVVAAVHAGWRGLSAGVIQATVAAMDIAPAKILAWIGPAIGQSAFEVDDVVRDAFVAADHAATNCFSPNARERWQADIKMLSVLALRRVGVTRTTDVGRCTYQDADDFFSHRRAAPCGRMASVIWIDSTDA